MPLIGERPTDLRGCGTPSLTPKIKILGLMLDNSVLSHISLQTRNSVQTKETGLPQSALVVANEDTGPMNAHRKDVTEDETRPTLGKAIPKIATITIDSPIRNPPIMEVPLWTWPL